MDYYTGISGNLQIRIDKPDILLAPSVNIYLAQVKEDRDKKQALQKSLWKIIEQNIKFYPWKKFKSEEELLRVLKGFFGELCIEEMEAAIDLFDKQGITKTIKYLFSCVE
jgi:hypothetical protein